MKFTTALLAVKQTPEVIQEEDGGIQYLTASDFASGGSGGLPNFQDLLYTDDTGAQFIYKDTGTTVPIITAYLVPAGTVYTVGANPRPYSVSDMAITSVDIGAKADAVATNDTGTFSLIALFKRSLQKLVSLTATQYLEFSVSPQVVAVATASAASSTFHSTTTRIVLTSTVDCWITIGATPTAAAHTAGSFFLSAGIPSYPIIVIGGTDKLAVIKDTIDGFLSIIESK